MLNARHNKDKHNGPGLSGSTVAQLIRLSCTLCTLLHCVLLSTSCALQLCCLLVCCAFVSCTTRTWNMRLVCLLATQLRQQQRLPIGCSRGSRWRVDFININALFSSQLAPPPTTRCASVAHGKVNALMRLSF